MRKIKFGCWLLVFICMQPCRSEGGDFSLCDQKLLDRVIKYRYALMAGMKTYGFFNIKLLEGLLRDSNIPSREISTRVADHIKNLDRRQKELTQLRGISSACGSDASKLLVNGADANGKELLFLYTLVDGLITNISQEDKKYYKDRIFVTIDQ